MKITKRSQVCSPARVRRVTELKTKNSNFKCHYAKCRFGKCHSATATVAGIFVLDTEFVGLVTTSHFMFDELTSCQKRVCQTLSLNFQKVISSNFAFFYSCKCIFGVDMLHSKGGHLPCQGGWDTGVGRSISI